MAIAVLYWVMSAGCWLYALKFGGRTGKWSFILFVLAMIGSFAARNGEDQWVKTDHFLLAVDGIYLVGLYVVALRSRHYWPIWSAGFQLLCVLSHSGPLLIDHVNPRIYRGLETMWMAPMMFTMVLGITKDRWVGQRTKG